MTIRTVMDTHFLHNAAILKFDCCDILNTEPIAGFAGLSRVLIHAQDCSRSGPS